MDATIDMSIYIYIYIYMVAAKAGLKEEEILDCLEDIQTDKLKNILKENTSYAVQAGAFGLPFMRIDRDKEVETFFGSDRF